MCRGNDTAREEGGRAVGGMTPACHRKVLAVPHLRSSFNFLGCTCSTMSQACTLAEVNRLPLPTFRPLALYAPTCMQNGLLPGYRHPESCTWFCRLGLREKKNPVSRTCV